MTEGRSVTPETAYSSRVAEDDGPHGRDLLFSRTHAPPAPWIGELDAPLALLLEQPEGLLIADASRGFGLQLGIIPATLVGRYVEEAFPTDIAILVANAALQVRRSGVGAQFMAAWRSDEGPKLRLDVIVRPSRFGEPGLVMELRPPPRSMTGAGRTVLFDQLNMINGGLHYIDDLQAPTAVDLSGILGYPVGHESANTETAWDLIYPEDVTLVILHRQGLSDLPDGQFAVVQFRMRHADGSLRWIELRERVSGRTRSGTVRRIMGFACDISERRRTLDALAQASQALLVAESEERKRIARELHDSTAQHLVAIDLTLSSLERRLGDDAAQKGYIRDIREALGAAHREVRTFSFLLHPPDLERRGFEATLRRFVEGFGSRTRLRVKLSVSGERRRLRPVGELTLFRIAQEALMNVLKHADARHVSVQVRYRPDEVRLDVLDDGVGLTAAELKALRSEGSSGVGIAGMVARMDRIGGSLQILPRKSGLLVRASLPLSPSEQDELGG